MPFQSKFDNALRTRLARLPRQSSRTAEWVPLSGASQTPASETADADRENVEITRTHRIDTAEGSLVIRGNAVLAACPRCQAPVSLRIWLRLADCWRCQTSVQLSDAVWDELAPVIQDATASPDPEGADVLSALIEPPPDDTPAWIDTRRTDPRLQELERLTRGSLAARWVRQGFSSVPAWLVSFLLHLMLLLLLALIMLSQPTSPPTITLSTFFRTDKAPGGEIRIENPDDTLVDDLQMANDLEIAPDEARDIVQQAQQDAETLRRDPTPLAPLPDLNEVRKNVTTRPDRLMSFVARDPRVRADIVHREGGTLLTEAAVARGLRWLASVQNEDGSWSLSRYERHDRRGNTGDAAGTSLALLPFLGAGQTHEYGIYKQTVARGLAWLLDHQKQNGDLRADYPGQAGMYAHGQAAIVLCEALAMTGDLKFRQPAQKAIDFIQRAQHAEGGWRYRPGQAGDTSILGWQLMALQSARAPNLGLQVDPTTLQMASNYLTDAAYRGRNAHLPTGAVYQYQPRQGQATPAMTAEALLCRMYLGWDRDDPRLMAGIDWLVSEHLPSRQQKNIYYWYYGTQVMHHYGGDAWKLWNRRIREILVSTQEKRGKRAGSWNPKDFKWGAQGGRIYTTSLAVCTLEVYYRHLPLFDRIELDSPPAAETP